MIRILNIFSCIVIVVLFTSYLSVDGDEYVSSKKNTYNTIQFSGCINKEIKAEMRFSLYTEMSKSGVPISTLNLELENTEENLLSLLISNCNKTIGKGTYRISNNKAQSITDNDGVFGYLNIINSNELPFYTENGKIVITEIDDDVLKGYLNLELENYNGKSVLISGNFLANK